MSQRETAKRDAPTSRSEAAKDTAVIVVWSGIFTVRFGAVRLMFPKYQFNCYSTQALMSVSDRLHHQSLLIDALIRQRKRCAKEPQTRYEFDHREAPRRPLPAPSEAPRHPQTQGASISRLGTI